MPETIRQETFKRDFTTGTSYARFSEAPMAWTLEIKDDVERFLADYDATGAVRGVEFLGRRSKSVEHYRSVAARQRNASRPHGPREKRP